MRDGIDDALNNIMGKRSNYTLDEIKEAQKLRKTEGGNLLDNLRKVTGRSLPSTSKLVSDNMDIMKLCNEHGIDLSSGSGSYSDFSSTDSDLNRELDKFTQELEGEYATYRSRDEAMADAPKSRTSEQSTDNQRPTPELFNGLADELQSTVLGQESFLKKLVIAFKRPYVMIPDGKLPANTMYITGPAYTGKHFALSSIVKRMCDRKIIDNPEVRVIDLSLYPSAGEEKLFLQDIYSALNSSNRVIAFENFENCHIAFLNMLAELVMKGSCKLSSRYVLQNGQLINVANSLAGEAVGSFCAEGKFLVFISRSSIEKLADCFGAPFVNSITDICETNHLQKDTITQIAAREMDRIKKISSEQIRFNLDCDEDIIEKSVKCSEKNVGLRGVLKFYEDFLDALVQIRLETDIAADSVIHIFLRDDRVIAECDGEEADLFNCLPASYTSGLEAVRKELDEIIGLKDIKEYILNLEEFYRVQKRRSEEGLKSGEVSKHMIFTGNPGTGKTTIARIISRYLKAIGILTGGQLVEVSRADLVGRYVGHTAPLTNQVIKSAIGGVLFIDEAYSLYRGSEDSFGLEAIDTLVKGIEDNRDNLIVILAGYSNEMQEFLTANSGLKSRFPNIINFPDYSGEELLKISRSIAAGKGYSIDEGADTSLLAYFNAVQAVRPSDAGNGRLARNKIEEAILNQSKRLVAEPDSDLSLLISEDFDLNDING